MVQVNNANNIVSQQAAPLIVYIDDLTWTPIIQGSSTAGTGSYSVQNGQCHKVGSLVTVTATVIWSSHTGIGNMLIAGLPFTVRALGSNYVPQGILNTVNITWPSGSLTIQGEFAQGTTRVNCVGSRSGNPNSFITMSSSGTIYFTGSYLN